MRGIAYGKRSKKRETRVILKFNSGLYAFFWIQQILDGALSIGLSTPSESIIEIGDAFRVSGKFTDHAPTLRRGKISSMKIKEMHATLHPPRIRDSIGIAQWRALTSTGKTTVARWPLDWFPVRKPEALIHVYSGSIINSKPIRKLKRTDFIVPVARNIDYMRGELILIPRRWPQIFLKPQLDLLGTTPRYKILCRIRPTKEPQNALYIATDQHKVVLP